MSTGLLEVIMADERKTTAVKLTQEAVDAAKIAAAFKGLTLYEYASQVLLEAANRDIEEGYRHRAGAAPKPKPKGPK